MTPSTPAPPSIPPCVAHCTHRLLVCAELIGDRLKSPPDVLPVAPAQVGSRLLVALPPPPLAWGARGPDCAQPPLTHLREPYLTTFSHGRQVQVDSAGLSVAHPALGHRSKSPALGGSAVGLLLAHREAREPPPPPGKMRVPGTWRAAASAAAPHPKPRGAWLEPRPANGVDWPGAARRSSSPCPAAPCCPRSIARRCCHPRPPAARAAA